MTSTSNILMYPYNNFLLKPSTEKILNLVEYLLQLESKEKNDWQVVNEKPSYLLHPLVLQEYFPSADFKTGQYDLNESQYIFNSKISEYRNLILEYLSNDQTALPSLESAFCSRSLSISNAKIFKDFIETCNKKNEYWELYTQYSPFISELNAKIKDKDTEISPISYFSISCGEFFYIYNHMKRETLKEQHEYDFQLNLEIQISSFMIRFEYNEEIQYWEPDRYLNNPAIDDIQDKIQKILGIKLIRRLHTFDDNYY